jgi:manganese/zinc/iron transport system permease protein
MSAASRPSSSQQSLLWLFAAVTAAALVLGTVSVLHLWPRIAELLSIRYNTLIVLVGASLLGASAGLIGSFAVLRRQALMGDALSHAALPGICLAFMTIGYRSVPALLLGALLSGLLGVAVVAALRRWTRIKEDAAIGIVLSVFFGAGLALSRLIQNTTSTGNKAGLDSYILGKTAGMTSDDVSWIAGISLVCLMLVLLLFKEFKLAAFDSGFANAQGWPAGRLDLLMMGLIALTVVLGLPAVGVVLMAALLILPGAAARFWTDRLGMMLVLSSLFGLAIGAVGTAISARYSGMPAGPIVVLVGTALFLISVTLAPRRGALARWLVERSFRRNLQRQRMLRTLYELSEQRTASQAAPFADIVRQKSWTPALAARLLSQLAAEGLVQPLEEGQPGALSTAAYLLTAAGRLQAARVTRAQRLWELFLTEQPELAGSVVTLDVQSIDESLPQGTIDALEAQLHALGRLPHLPPSAEAAR